MTTHRRRSLGFLIVAVVPAIALGVWLTQRTSTPKPTETSPEDPTQQLFPIPPFSESFHLGTQPDVGYVGIATCKECHSTQHESYLHTAHSKALSEPDPKTEPPDGAFEHLASGRSYRVYRRDNRLHHEELLRTPEGMEVGRLDFPVRYLVGSGNFSRTYLVEVDGFLSESPITWYAQKKRWTMSPGYDAAVHRGFQRQVAVDCLVCHAGQVQQKAGTSEAVILSEQRIGCENCHGPGARHVDRHRNGKHPPGTDDPTIVNPRKLPRSRLEAICAVCHQQGATSVYVRGRNVNDFRPGMPLTDYRIDYQFNVASDRMAVVGHFEQLRQSACYQKSSDMSCLTCHDPHLRQKPKDPASFYREKCLKCHTVEACTLELGQRLKKEPTDNCNACHAPRGDTDIPHIAFTHHRIGRHSSQPKPVPGNLGDLVAIEDNPRLTEIDRKRNLGLAYFQMAFKAPDRDQAFASGKRARDLLEDVYQAGLRDAWILRSLALIHRQESNPSLARLYAQELLDGNDPPMEAQVDALKILTEGHLANNEIEQGIVLLMKLTRLRRTADDWRFLGTCYLETNQINRALEAFEKALGIDPFDHRTHTVVAEAHRRRGDVPRAREHDQKAQWLAQRAKS
jgi:hypothetical protein